MKAITLSVANGIRGDYQNTVYDHKVIITDLGLLAEAVQWDNVGGEFQNSYRSNKTFVSADCLLMDCDNDHSEDSAKWLTVDSLSERLPDVQFAVVYSKSHMRQKGKFTPRPRWHVYLPLRDIITDSKKIRKLKEKLLHEVPEFDSNAKDAARFFYGIADVTVEIREGSMCIDEYLAIYGADDIETDFEIEQEDSSVIPEGERNNSLFKIALKLLRVYDPARARELFDKACCQCNPPLPVEECTTIWNSASKIAKGFEDKIKEKQRKVLTPLIVEQTLKNLGISVRFNVITKKMEVSDLPEEIKQFVPSSYYKASERRKKTKSCSSLPTILQSYFKDHHYHYSKDFIRESLSALSEDYNPITDMLNQTTWDGYDRITDLERVLKIDADPIQCVYLKKWLHQAIAIAHNDNGDLSNEFVLVLQGKQGAGKTNFFRALAVKNEWFRDGVVIDMRNKDSIIHATSRWICELGELDSTSKKGQSSLKGFLTMQTDNYRKPYASESEEIERRTVFCATVNSQESICDDMGSRRYVYIHCDSLDKNFIYHTMTPQWCMQLWKQVYEELYLKNGSKGYFLTADEVQYSQQMNLDFIIPVKGEIEILEAFDWTCEQKRWFTIMEVKSVSSTLAYLDPRKVSRAVQMALKKNGIDDISKYKKVSHGITKFLLPAKFSASSYK